MTTQEVDIFIPCCTDQLFPQTGFNMIKVLNHLGVKTHYNQEQTCCGQTAFNNGFWEDAKEIGEKFIHDFNQGRYVVGPSTSCIGYIKNHYEKLFYNTGSHLEYKTLQGRIFEFTDYIVNILRVYDIGTEFHHRVTFHDSCSGLRAYGIKEEPRILLNHVKGLELIEMQSTDECCGFGGAFSLKFEPISVAMTHKKVEHALETGAEYIIGTDSSCLGNMDAYISKNKLPIKCIHIADVLANGLS